MTSWLAPFRLNAPRMAALGTTRWKLARMTELTEEIMPVGRLPREKKKRGGARDMSKVRHRPKNINKVRSISARCKGCGTLIVLRLEWTPGPLIKFAEEIIDSVKSCHGCGRKLEKPSMVDIKLTLSNEE